MITWIHTPDGEEIPLTGSELDALYAEVLAFRASEGSPAEPVVAYMCKVDFDWELGQASGGNRIYASIEDLKSRRKCWEECGIVEVEVKQRQVIEAGKI